MSLATALIPRRHTGAIASQDTAIRQKAAIAGVLQLFFSILGAGRFYIGSKAIGGCQLG